MKLIATTLLSLSLAISAYAVEPVGSVKPVASKVDKKTSQSKLASDMRTMLSSIVSIQRAGFYNNKSGIKDATNKLVENLDTILATDPTTYLPDDKITAGKFAEKRVRMIKLYADDLLASLDTNNMNEAMEDYNQIVAQCTSCHSRIRQREWK